MSTNYFSNYKHNQSYKENYIFKKKVMSNFQKKTDPISHRLNTIDGSDKTTNQYRTTIKTSFNTVNKPSLIESFNKVFKNENLERSSSKKTFAITKNSTSQFKTNSKIKKIFVERYNNQLRLNDQRDVIFRTNIRVDSSYGKPSSNLIQFNDKQIQLPSNYYEQHKGYKPRRSECQFKSKVFEEHEIIRSPSNSKRPLHPFIKDHMDDIISYKNALNYRIEKLTPKISGSTYLSTDVSQNSSKYNYYKQRQKASQIY